MEGRIGTRRTMDRETREAFMEAFQTHFPEDSMDTDGIFDKLFSIMPEALARHNQEGISYSLGNSCYVLFHIPQTLRYKTRKSPIIPEHAISYVSSIYITI